jgi:hypothetical protein
LVIRKNPQALGLHVTAEGCGYLDLRDNLPNFTCQLCRSANLVDRRSVPPRLATVPDRL